MEGDNMDIRNEREKKARHFIKMLLPFLWKKAINESEEGLANAPESAIDLAQSTSEAVVFFSVFVASPHKKALNYYFNKNPIHRDLVFHFFKSYCNNITHENIFLQLLYVCTTLYAVVLYCEDQGHKDIKPLASAWWMYVFTTTIYDRFYAEGGWSGFQQFIESDFYPPSNTTNYGEVWDISVTDPPFSYDVLCSSSSDSTSESGTVSSSESVLACNLQDMSAASSDSDTTVASNHNPQEHAPNAENIRELNDSDHASGFSQENSADGPQDSSSSEESKSSETNDSLVSSSDDANDDTKKDQLEQVSIIDSTTVDENNLVTSSENVIDSSDSSTIVENSALSPEFTEQSNDSSNLLTNCTEDDQSSESKDSSNCTDGEHSNNDTRDVSTDSIENGNESKSENLPSCSTDVCQQAITTSSPPYESQNSDSEC